MSDCTANTVRGRWPSVLEEDGSNHEHQRELSHRVLVQKLSHDGLMDFRAVCLHKGNQLDKLQELWGLQLKNIVLRSCADVNRWHCYLHACRRTRNNSPWIILVAFFVIAWRHREGERVNTPRQDDLHLFDFPLQCVTLKKGIKKCSHKAFFSYPTTTTRHRRIPEECGSLLRQRPNTHSFWANKMKCRVSRPSWSKTCTPEMHSLFLCFWIQHKKVNSSEATKHHLITKETCHAWIQFSVCLKRSKLFEIFLVELLQNKRLHRRTKLANCTTQRSKHYLWGLKPCPDTGQTGMSNDDVIESLLCRFLEVLWFELSHHISEAGVAEQWADCVHGWEELRKCGVAACVFAV